MNLFTHSVLYHVPGTVQGAEGTALNNTDMALDLKDQYIYQRYQHGASNYNEAYQYYDKGKYGVLVE